MAPPLLPLTALLSASPPVIVRRSMVTLPALMSKMRVTSLPDTANWLALAPLIVRASVMLSSLARGMVPFNPGANWMTSAPGVVFADVIAARSEPGPLSSRFMTVKVLGRARPSSASRAGRGRRGAWERERWCVLRRMRNLLCRSGKTGLPYFRGMPVRAPFTPPLARKSSPAHRQCLLRLLDGTRRGPSWRTQGPSGHYPCRRLEETDGRPAAGPAPTCAVQSG